MGGCALEENQKKAAGSENSIRFLFAFVYIEFVAARSYSGLGASRTTLREEVRIRVSTQESLDWHQANLSATAQPLKASFTTPNDSQFAPLVP